MSTLAELTAESSRMFWNGRIATSWAAYTSIVRIFHADDDGSYTEVDSFRTDQPITSARQAEKALDTWWNDFYVAGGDDMLGRPSDRFHAAEPPPDT
jgi:hypothetical protein